MKPQAFSKVIDADEGKRAESPEDKCMREAGQRPLADDFGLAEDFPDEVLDSLCDGPQRPAEVFASLEDVAEDGSEAEEEERCGGGNEDKQENDFDGREVLRFCGIHTGIIPLAVTKAKYGDSSLRSELQP